MPFRVPISLMFVAGLAIPLALGAPKADAEGIGVVLLHAGGSWPGQFERLAPKLEEAGYGVAAPEACWSVHRNYAHTVDECLADVDSAIATLRGEGYDRFVVAGHDLGALNALYYADGHSDLAGVIVWGPYNGGRGGSDVDIEHATQLIDAGKGDERSEFSNGYILTTPRALLSFRGPDGPLADQEQLVSHISAPILWITSNDSIGPRDPTPTYNLAPATPLNVFIRSTTDHFSMVDKSAPDVIGWLDKVKAAGAAR